MDEENILFQVLTELGIQGVSHKSYEELLNIATNYLLQKEKISNSNIDYSNLVQLIKNDCCLKIGDIGPRVWRLEKPLRKWGLLSSAPGQIYRVETEEAIVRYQGIKRTGIVVNSTLGYESIIAIRDHARTALDDLTPATLANIVKGNWKGAIFAEKFERTVYSSTRLPDGELLVAGNGSLAEKRYLERPLFWTRTAVMTDNPSVYPLTTPLLVVGRVIRAIALLASYARTCAIGKFIAVTGSSGKTSTKEMIWYALRYQLLAYRTAGTSNSTHAVADAVVNSPLGSAVNVIECGLGGGGSSLEAHSNIVRPHVAVVTSVAEAHLGGYASVDEIALRKLEIAKHLEPGGCLLMDGDSPVLEYALTQSPFLRDKRVIRFGIGQRCQVRVFDCDVTEAGTRFELEIFGEQRTITIPMYGIHWSKMAAVAVASAVLVGGDLDASILGLGDMKIQNGRGRFICLDGSAGSLRIFDSHFSANPGSMTADLDSYQTLFDKRGIGRKIAVIGAYRELGIHMDMYHELLAKQLVEVGFEKLYLIGDREFDSARGMLNIAGISYAVWSKIEDALKTISTELRANDFVFIKAPNNKHLIQVLPYLRSQWH